MNEQEEERLVPEQEHNSFHVTEKIKTRKNRIHIYSSTEKHKNTRLVE